MYDGSPTNPTIVCLCIVFCEVYLGRQNYIAIKKKQRKLLFNIRLCVGCFVGLLSGILVLTFLFYMYQHLLSVSYCSTGLQVHHFNQSTCFECHKNGLPTIYYKSNGSKIYIRESSLNEPTTETYTTVYYKSMRRHKHTLYSIILVILQSDVNYAQDDLACSPRHGSETRQISDIQNVFSIEKSP